MSPLMKRTQGDIFALFFGFAIMLVAEYLFISDVEREEGVFCLFIKVR